MEAVYKLILAVLFVALVVAVVIFCFGSCSFIGWLVESTFDDLTGGTSGFDWFFSN